MSDLGTIKPLAKSSPISPLNKDAAKKQPDKKKKTKKDEPNIESESNGHINEYI